MHLGILGFLSEASEIQQELGVSAEAAFAIQRERADERMREYDASKAESNVVYGVNFRRGTE